MPLLLAFLIVPLIEIALFIQVGGAIGLGWTLAIVVITAVVGASMVRRQGKDVMGRVQNSFQSFQDPSQPLAEGAMILFSGALLLTPGFFTDFVGFALLIPGVRAFLFNRLRDRIKMRGFSTSQNQTYHTDFGREDIVEGDYEVHDAPKNKDQTPSGWRRH